MTSKFVGRGSLRRWRRASLIFAVTASLGGCSSFSLADLNPFGGERYKMQVDPIVPASTVYDQGLAKL
ncbi:MAG TPA: hypothetical protein VN715_02625, partial [Roseiarcus sp.]|nr:hypothetical protein [Roseiarcus sp.]